MDYVDFMKGKYTKMALKGTVIPFGFEYEKALVAFSCIAMINSNVITNVLKMEEQVDQKFMDSFENGSHIDVMSNTNNIKIMMGVRYRLKLISNYLIRQIERISPIIEPHLQEIDIGISKYYTGNSMILKKEAENYSNIANDITTSFKNSFSGNMDSISLLEEEALKNLTTKADIEKLNDKFSTALGLKEVLKW